VSQNLYQFISSVCDSYYRNIQISTERDPLREPPSAFLDWEYEEHKVRLNTLAVTHEVELVRLDTVNRERDFIIKKQDMELKLLEQKLHVGIIIPEDELQ